MSRAVHHIDRALRGGANSELGNGSIGIVRGLAMTVLGGTIYGLVMGAFGGFTGDRTIQIIYSGAKVPMLIVLTGALAMPSFFVLNSLLGLRSDFGEVITALATTQTAVAVVLASLAPYTALWYASTTDYQEAILFNAVMFAVASLAAQRVLRQRYVPLIARNPRHRVMLRVWLATYAFVGIQMGWVLRPFIGQPGRQVTFFREDAWGNAYIFIVDMVLAVFTRRQ
jgi:hypothetical protein